MHADARTSLRLATGKPEGKRGAAIGDAYSQVKLSVHARWLLVER